MNKVSKKLVSAALTATTTLWLSGAAAFVPAVYAQSTADLQSQIAALLAQITALQGQLGQGGSSMSYTFAKDLTLGSKGTDVTNLQQVLVNKGYLKVAATGYFGSLTKAALVQWQAAAGVSPTSGYFGPKSRAAMNAAMAGGGSGGSGGVVVAPPASGLAVSLAADSATGSAIAGAGQIKVGKFNFTASNAAGVTVTDLQFTKVGVLSDANVQNLYLADAMTGLVVAQYQSLTNGVATFSGLALNVAAGQTWQGELRMDLSTGATAGNTIAWQLSKVTTSGNGAVTGMPTSNALTVTSVSNPAIATMSLTANAVGTTIDAGTVSALVSSWTSNVSNSSVNLQNMQFTFVGSANPSDIKNLRLLVNGAEVAKLDMAASVVNFNFASTPIKLGTGNATIQIFADVLGSPNRTFTFSLLQPYRVTAIDTQYNTGVTVSINSASQSTVTINPGTMSVSLSSNTPTSPVPNGASNVTIAKFRVYAAGEPVKVMWLDATIAKTGGTNFTTTNNLTNVKLIDDAGGQFGNTINTPGIVGGSSSGQCTVGAALLTCHFGTSASPVNYIVPANTSRELSLVVDIGSSNDVTTLQGGLVGGLTGNLQGQISYQTATSGASTGATLQVSTSALTPTVNSAFSAPTYVAGANGVKIASWVLSASSAQGAQVTSLTFAKPLDAAMDLQNMKVMVGATQFGASRTTIGDSETAVAYSGATPIVVAQGGSVTVDVYADIITTTGAGAHNGDAANGVLRLTGWSALGSISNSAISFPGAVNGQSMTISSGPTLTVGKASASAPAQQVVMGSTNNSLFTVSLSADNVEDIRVTDVTLLDTITGNAAGIASFQNLALYDGSTLVAGPLSLSVAGTTTGTVHFSMNQPVVVSKNGTKNLELRGDVATFSSGGAQSGSGHTLSVNATSSVTALGNSSNQAAIVSGTPAASVASVYRTKVSLASSLLGSSAGRTRVAVDDIANLNFSADTAYKAVLGTVTLKFSGQAVSNGAPVFAVDLIDANTNAILGSATTTNCTPGAGNVCNVTFNPVFTIDAGTTKTTKVRVNSGSFYNSSQTSDSLSVVVNASADVTINDGSVGSVPLPGTVVPFTVVNVSFE